MFINGIGTAVPATRYTQRDCWDVLRDTPLFNQLSPRAQAITRKVLTGDSGIATRHLALNALTEAFDLNPDALHQRFTKTAPALATEAATRALARSGISPREIGGLIISTCTGYLCPGLTSYVSEKLGLPANTICLDLVGQGCGAALPNLRAADALIRSGSARHVICICVEVCSAALYLDNDPGVLISACLFADGAAATVVSAEPAPNLRQVRWLTSETVLKPQHRDELRFDQRGGMLFNILKPSVSKLAAASAGEVLNRTLANAGKSRADIRSWNFHPGGRDVLLALRDQLVLSDADLQHSADVLREFGNTSSPSVLFVLDVTLRNNASAGLWWMSSFGAGFTCHGALLEVS
jgi:predicted naringenin-chalcone synthase